MNCTMAVEDKPEVKENAALLALVDEAVAGDVLVAVEATPEALL